MGIRTTFHGSDAKVQSQLGTSYDVVKEVQENLDSINYVADNLDTITNIEDEIEEMRQLEADSEVRHEDVIEKHGEVEAHAAQVAIDADQVARDRVEADQSQVAAAQSEANAKDSELAAKASELASAASEASAQADAQSAAQSAQNSSNSADAAHDSEVASANSEYEADQSAIASEASRQASEAAQVISESARDASVSAKDASELAQVGSENAKAASEIARDHANTSAAQASASELASKNSEANSATSEANAALSATASADSATASESSRQASVGAKDQSIAAQAASELARDQSQAAQASSETARDESISSKVAAEQAETNAEAHAFSADIDRQGAESAKTSAELARDQSEDSAVRSAGSASAALNSANRAGSSEANSADSAAASEASRLASESAEAASVIAQAASELARDESVTAKNASEAAQLASESAKTSSESARDTAVANAALTDSDRIAAESAKAASESARDASVAAKNTSESAANTATTKAGEASTSAANAASSASASAGSEASALSHKNSAASSASTATTQANRSQTEANRAESEADRATLARTEAESLVGRSLQFRGAWDASAGNFPTPDATEVAEYYRISVAGTMTGTQGSMAVAVGDNLYWDLDANHWYKIDNTDQVTSVAGKQGAVTLTPGDVGAAPASHSHNYDKYSSWKVAASGTAGTSDITSGNTVTFSGTGGATVTRNGDNINIDAADTYAHPSTHPATMITEDSGHRFVSDSEKASWNAKSNAHSHPYRSNTWVPSWSDVTGKPATYAPSAHGHGIGDVTGLQSALDGKAATHSHPYASDTHNHDGRYLRADTISTLAKDGRVDGYDGHPLMQIYGDAAYLGSNNRDVLQLASKSTIQWKSATGTYDIYSEGNKPTPEAIGAMSKAGDTMGGNLRVDGHDSGAITFTSDVTTGTGAIGVSSVSNEYLFGEAGYNYYIRVGNNKFQYHTGGTSYYVYHTGNKPSKSDVGLGSVNNWSATSATNDFSTTKYATAKAVADTYALAAGGHSHNYLSGSGWQTVDVNALANSVPAGQMRYDQYTTGSNGGVGMADNANSLLTLGQHAGGYTAQLSFSSDGKLYHRDNPSNTVGSWEAVYTEGNKPTKNDVGLGSVNNWAATSSTSDSSNSKYATAGAVKAAYDKASHSHPYAASSHGHSAITAQGDLDHSSMAGIATGVYGGAVGASGSSQGFPTSYGAQLTVNQSTHRGFQIMVNKPGTMWVRGFEGNPNSWYKIYSTLDKPTKSDVGLSAVNNWSATSSVSDSSTSKYATASAVKTAYDKGVEALNKANSHNHSAGNITSGVFSMDRMPKFSAPYGTEGVAHIRGDGVMEVGRYIDFHAVGSSADYDMRLDCRSANALNVTGGTLEVEGQRVFANDYHPRADKLTTARTLSLTGDVTGSVSFDGSANVSINAVVSSNSHNHDSAYLGKTAKAADAEKLDGINGADYARSNTFDYVQEFEYVGGISSPNNTNGSSSAWNKDGNVPIKLTRGNNSAAMWLHNGDTTNSRTLYIQSGHADYGNYAYISGTIDLNPYGGSVKANGHTVYSAGNKPSAADIGAAATSHTHSYLPLSGGTLSGALNMGSHRITGYGASTHYLDLGNTSYAPLGETGMVLSGYSDIMIHADNDNSNNGEAVVIGAGSNAKLRVGGSASASASNALFTFNGNAIYHAGNKPSAADIGAAASSHTHSKSDAGLSNVDNAKQMRTASKNGYYGLVDGAGSDSQWIRTTVNGIIPYQSGGHGSLGTSSWPFANIYSNNFVEGGTSLVSKYLGISAKAASASSADWADQVDVNTSASTSEYSMLWASGDTIYNTNGKLKYRPSDGQIHVVDGHLRLDDSSDLYLGTGMDIRHHCNGSHYYTDLNSGIGNWYVRDGTTIRFTFDDAGHFTATGNITAHSDIRVKRDIQPIENAVDKVQQLRGVTYERTDSITPRQTGVIAQEVQKVLPEAVVESSDEDKTLSVAYGNMVGLLIEAIKEQQTQIDELKKQIEEVK